MRSRLFAESARWASWLAKGGDAALASYGGDTFAVPQNQSIGSMTANTDCMFEKHRVYVHAGVDPGEVPWTQEEVRSLNG